MWAALVLVAACADATYPTVDEGFHQRTLEVDGVARAYTVYVPPTYDPALKWPVILFLHGGGQRGTDGLKPTEEGIGPHLLEAPQRWPAIVLFPQIGEGEIWQDASALVALAALDSAQAEFNVDRARIYATGLSLGANGTWYLGYHHPERFAALVPIAGTASGPPRLPAFVPGSATEAHARIAERLSSVPIFVVHGEEDGVVPVSEARGIVAALEAVGGPVRYAELSRVGHRSWDVAYDSPEVIVWLFGNRLR